MDAAERDVDVAHLDERCSLRHGHGLVLHVGSRAAPAVERVEADRDDQDDAGDHVLAGRVHAQEASP